MSHALDRPDLATPSRPPIQLRRGTSLTAAWTLFAMTVGRLVRSQRMLSLLALYLLPIVLLLMIRQTTVVQESRFELQLALTLFPHTLLPLAALLYAPGLIQDEVEEQTLTYLLIRPIPRWLIFLAKLAASIAVTCLLAAVFAVLVEVLIWWNDPAFSEFIVGRSAILAAIFALALTAYNALFAFVGLIVRKSLAFGVFYIIVIEGFFASINFVIREATVMFYVRDLAMRWLEADGEFWNIKLATAPGAGECVATLLIASAVLAALSAAVFTLREFRVKTPEAT
jgi:ABC-2 type transport system permease protein